MLLTAPHSLGGARLPSRVVFGPHVTNLGEGRAFSARHTAYYAARAAGGAGLVVTESASVVDDDWPYERAPLASACGPGWASIVAACGATPVLASLGHTGAQGSSAHSQRVLWAPSAVADVVSRELPAVMEQPEISRVVKGFAEAAALAIASGCAGVEVDAGEASLVRQFLSGLTNLRGDAYGADRTRFLREVLEAVRAALPEGALLALRLSCDELAPWAGITPELALDHARAVSGLVDLLVVVRAGPYAGNAYRPGGHEAPGFNRDLARRFREAVGVPVVLQGSVVDPAMAEQALQDGVADLVEMTRAQIADPALVAAVREGRAPRPCVLCNQACRVRDGRNPVVSCVVEPRSGHETTDPVVDGHDPARDVLVVGGGPAGLECARVLALRGHRVEVRDRRTTWGGVAAQAAVLPGKQRFALATKWLLDECVRLGVVLTGGSEVTEADLAQAASAGRAVVLCTGSRPAGRTFGAGDQPTTGRRTLLLDTLDVLQGDVPPGVVVVHDPVGGHTGTALAEHLAGHGRRVALVSQDPVAGTLLSLTGDLADANSRLQRAGVRVSCARCCAPWAPAGPGSSTSGRGSPARSSATCSSTPGTGSPTTPSTRPPSARCTTGPRCSGRATRSRRGRSWRPCWRDGGGRSTSPGSGR